MEFRYLVSGAGKIVFPVIPNAVSDSLDHDQDAFAIPPYHLRCIILHMAHEKSSSSNASSATHQYPHNAVWLPFLVGRQLMLLLTHAQFCTRLKKYAYPNLRISSMSIAWTTFSSLNKTQEGVSSCLRTKAT